MSVEHEGCSQKSEAAADRIRQLYQSLLDQQWTNRKGDTQQTGIRDILVVSPYNIHTNFLGRACPRGLRLAPSINSRARKPTLS